MEDRSDRVRGWYPTGTVTNADREAWYAVSGGSLPEEQPVSPAAEDDGRRRKRRRTRIIALCLCGALLLSAAGTVLARALRRERTTVVEKPGASASRERVPDGGETYDDFRVYFENYYSGSDSVSIPRAQTDGDVSLTLVPAAGEELSLNEIYERVSPAVVGVTATRGGMDYSWGTGVVFTPDGYVITNTHIIAGCDGASVSFPDGSSYEALLVGEDSASDIAVLKIDGNDLPYAVFGDSDALGVGDAVAAIGNPLGEEYAGTMTNGIISAINRNVRNNGHAMTLLQTNAALNEGNSGGPLVNAWGQVIGITNMKIMSSFYAAVEGIGFAIPSAVVKDVADQLIASGVVAGHPSLGITAAPVNDEAIEVYGLPAGVYVATVSEQSASGLEVGDIILAVNGTPVSTVAEVNAIKEDFQVGDTLTLTIYRSGGEITIVSVLIDQADVQ